MGEIVDFDELQPHTISEVICVKCYKRWIAVRPAAVFLKDIYCPNCGPGFVIETGQEFDSEYEEDY